MDIKSNYKSSNTKQQTITRKNEKTVKADEPKAGKTLPNDGVKISPDAKDDKNLNSDGLAGFEKGLNSVAGQDKIVENKEVNTIAKSPDEKENKYDDFIIKASENYNIDPNLLKAMIKKESEFNPNKKSGAGARGLLQLMPKTAKSLGVKKPFDPEQSINGGAKYISQLLNKYDGNLEKSLAGYNAGPGNVSKYGGVPPFKETRDYVEKVTGYYNDYKMMASGR
ncbi:MAG: lytic transglycosylase domain-containing protein [Candidatus Eremiobacterota bacterium]